MDFLLFSGVSGGLDCGLVDESYEKKQPQITAIWQLYPSCHMCMCMVNTRNTVRITFSMLQNLHSTLSVIQAKICKNSNVSHFSTASNSDISHVVECAGLKITRHRVWSLSVATLHQGQQSLPSLHVSRTVTYVNKLRKSHQVAGQVWSTMHDIGQLRIIK